MFILVNLDKKVVDGSLFNKLLNVKNPGEWISLSKKIVDDHFTLKNKTHFGMIKKKLMDLCKTMAGQFQLTNVQHKNFIEDFMAVINHKFEIKISDMTKNVKAMLR